MIWQGVTAKTKIYHFVIISSRFNDLVPKQLIIVIVISEDMVNMVYFPIAINKINKFPQHDTCTCMFLFTVIAMGK